MAKGKNFGGFGGGMNMQAMMKQAQKMQENMMKAQEEIAQMETTGTAGGGMVTATVTGTSTLRISLSRRSTRRSRRRPRSRRARCPH